MNPSGTVTFLFTDIAASTRLWEQYPQAMNEALARHDSLLQQAIESNGGHIVKTTGDGLHAVFEAAADAVGAVLVGQSALVSAPWPETGPLRVRMALHTGEAEQRAGDYYGPAVNRAARLMAAASGGQVLLSAATAELSRDRLPAGAALSDLGRHRLKDLGRPEQVFQLLHPDLPADFPPLKTLTTIANNLPVQVSSFVGREREMADLERLLSPGTQNGPRLVTLAGPGGTGKTRLSLQVAAGLLTQFSDGIWLVELAPVSDPALVVQALATTLSLRERPGLTLLDLVTNYLRTRRLLLILDNCEHLIDAVADLTQGLLQAAPNLQILASSREALGIFGEQVYRVPSLSLPDSTDLKPAALSESEAARLFIDRAREARSEFAVTEDNAAAVAEICARLDGVPLAIELAAARVSILTPQQIAARLDDRFRLLGGGRRTAMPRQQTLRALIDWSYDLLSEPERLMFRRTSVFAGGWTYAALEAVCPDLDVLTLLAELVNKSLVLFEEAEGKARYRLLETIRQYAREKLFEAGEAAEARKRHLAYYLHLADGHDPRRLGQDQLRFWDQCEVEHDNYRAALRWGLDQDPVAALHIAVALAEFWVRRGYRLESHEWLQSALDRVDSLPPVDGEQGRPRQVDRALAMIALGNSHHVLGDGVAALAVLEACILLCREIEDMELEGLAQTQLAFISALRGEAGRSADALSEAIAIGRETGNKRTLAFALGVRSNATLFSQADLASARADAEESLRLALEAGELWGAALGTANLARIDAFESRLDEARAGFQETENLLRQMKDGYMVNSVRSELAHVERRAGNLVEARSLYRETIVAWRDLSHPAGVARELECFAFIARAEGVPDRAAVLLGAADALRKALGAPMTEFEQDEYDQEVADLRAGMAADGLETNWAKGRDMTLDQALDYALS